MNKIELLIKLHQLILPHEIIGGDLMDEIHHLIKSQITEEEDKGTISVEWLENGYPQNITLKGN